jgi:hypothetical protein
MDGSQRQTLIWKEYILKLSRHHHAGAKGERKYSSYSFLSSALGGMSSQSHLSRALPRETISGAHLIGGWVGLRSGLDTQGR